MVGVIVRRQCTSDLHSVIICVIDEVIDGIGRVNHHALTSGAIANQVDKVDHLLGKRVPDGEVTARKQLLEIHLIIYVIFHAFRLDAPEGLELDGGVVLSGANSPSNMTFMSAENQQNHGVLDSLTEGQRIPFGGNRWTAETAPEEGRGRDDGSGGSVAPGSRHAEGEGKSPRRERDPWDTKGERDKPATEGRGAAKCEQKGCGQLVKHKGGAGSESSGSQDTAYRDGLDNPNRQPGSYQETDVVPKKGL